MNGILVSALYVLAGVVAYAALNHGLIAWRRPIERTHLLFALSCLAVALYVVAKAGAYGAASARELVEMRRWELSAGLVFLLMFSWFVSAYTAVRPKRFLAGLSVLFGLVFVANLGLPYGISFVELPDFQHLTLPWGERVADVRVHQRGAWHVAMWVGIALMFAFGIYACVRQYQSGARRRGSTLALALGLFLLFVFFNQAVNLQLVRFIHTAEFGFVALVAVMSLELVRERGEGAHRMQAVLDNVPAAVYLKDTAGRYLLVNRVCEQVLGVSANGVAGKTDHDLFRAPQADAFRGNDRQVLESRAPCEFEEVISRDGGARTYRSLKFPLLDADGIPYAVCCVTTDVTEARRTDQEMRRLRGELWHADRVAQTGALSASLAHELNQPLAAMLSNAQAALRLLSGARPDLGEIRQILEDIASDDRRASRVIASLRALVKQQASERALIDVAEALSEVLHLLRSELRGRQIAVTTDFEPGCAVVADKVQIQQVVLNLVMNAVEAMSGESPGDRRLHIRCLRSGAVVRVAVKDSGRGLAPGEVDSVFEAFRTSKPQGMGIGLSICRSIAEAHGGTLNLEPNEGRGVTAVLTLPLAGASATAAKPENEAESALPERAEIRQSSRQS